MNEKQTTLDAAAAIVAIAAAIALCLRALLHFDDSWDGTSYHLVFAAYRAGILTLRDFTPLPLVQEYYQGFPPLLDLLRGFTWRVTGSALLLQIYDLLAIFTLCTFWMVNFRLPPQWTFLALLSVPLIQIGATTLYVDVFVNCFFALALSTVTAAFIEWRPLSRNETAAALLALAVAANTKLQFVALAALMFAAMCGYQAIVLAAHQRYRALGGFLAIAFVTSFVIFLSAWRNIIEFGNPLYPTTISILGHRLPGEVPLTIWFGPNYLDAAPQWLKWLFSVLEFRAFEGRDLLYTIDQHSLIPIGAPPVDDINKIRPPSFRMGGYFLPLVLGLLIACVAFTARLSWPQRARWFVPLVVTTVVVAPLPGSHQLRYFCFWMINLVFLAFYAARDVPQGRPIFHAFVLTAFVSLGLWTGWRYFDVTPYSVQDHIRVHGIDKAITGQDICLENRNRDSILFTAIFHPPGHYRVIDLPGRERCGNG